MNRDKLRMDFQMEYFYKQEDFLLLVWESIHKWFESVIGRLNNKTVLELLKTVEKNQPVHELLYFYFYFGTFYVKLRQNIRKGYTTGLTHA